MELMIKGKSIAIFSFLNPLLVSSATGFTTGGGFPADVVPSGGFPFVVSSTDFIILLVSIVIWVFSLFFFYRTVEMQKWIFREIKDAPNPEAGEFILLMVSFLIIVAWFLWIYIVGTNRFDFFDIFYYPKRYTPAFLLASFYPVAVGLFKVFTVIVAFPKVPMNEHSVRSLRAPLVYMIAGLINFIASIVTLIKVIRP
jgi:hypothetical protein